MKILHYILLCELPLGQDMVMSLPDPLNGHGGGKETISYAKDGKDDNKNDDQGKASLHRRWETIQNSPTIATVLAAGHPWVIAIER